LPPPPLPTLFPYTTLFRSLSRYLYNVDLLIPVSLLISAKLYFLLSYMIIARCTFSSGFLGRPVVTPFFCALRNPFLVFSLITSRSEEHTSELQSRFDLVCR